MSLEDATRERIESLITSSDVTLFMKGSRQAPQCGFSATVVRILDGLIPDYDTVDVLSDPEVRDGIKLFSSWPTIPQLYVKGEFVGGCDIIQELQQSGELAETLGVELPELPEGGPELSLTEAGADALRQVMEQQGGPGREVHLSVDAKGEPALYLAPAAAGEVEVERNGIRIFLDAMSARRASGLAIDAVKTDRGIGFHIHDPSAATVHPMPVQELKALLDSDQAFELLDARTPEERATASIPGSRLLSEDEAKRLESLPKDTMLVFHCHHGGRSQAAAQHFAAAGFQNVHNVVGGIDAWSTSIDPSVPRY